MESLRIPVGDGLVLDAVATGPADGQVVLLLHGFPQTSWSWRRVWPGLADAGFRVIAPDQRGYSPDARPVGVEHYRMPALVGDALAVLDAVSADRAHVVGHDWGAAVAWQLAGRHPDRLRTLTAVSVPHPVAFVEALRSDPDQRTRSRYMKDWQDPATEQRLLDSGFHELFGIPSADAGHYVERMRQPGALSAALSWYRAQSLDDLEGLGPISVPTLHVWSDGDAALGPAAAHATGEHVEGPYRFEVLHGVSHWVPEQAADVLVRHLLEHLRSSDERAGGTGLR
jgi:pimeloyl-ACP methyl ester carboxylesterase